MRLIVVAAVFILASGAASSAPNDGTAPTQQNSGPTATDQPRRRRRKDGSDLQKQLQDRGIPYDGLSVVQMQEALKAANSAPDQDSKSCPGNGAFDNAPQHEYCVIGAGPGGLQMAAYLHAAKRDYIVFERAAVAGSFYQKYPRHRNLISINKRYTGRNNAEFNWRHDWNSLLSPSSGPASDAPRFWDFSDDYFPAADAWVEYADRYSQGLNIRYSTEVTKVSRKRKSLGADFVLHTQSHSSETVTHTRCKTLIVATSLPKAYIPPIEGLAENSIGYDDDDFSIDPEDFRNKTVLILGKKQSAMETAKNIYGHTAELHLISPSRARIAWESHYVGDIRAINAEVLDAYQLKSLDSFIESDLGGTANGLGRTTGNKAHFVRRADGKVIIKWSSAQQETDPSVAAYAKKTNVEDDQRRQPEFARIMHAEDDPSGFLGERSDGPAQAFDGFDYVLRCTGWRMETDIFDEGLEPIIGAGNKYPQMTSAYGHPTVDGLYYAGTLMHGNDFKKSAGGFIHGFRYLVRAQHRILELRNHGVVWPGSEVMQLVGSADRTELMFQLGQRLLPRVSEMSGPYQMFGQLIDLYVLTSYEDSDSPVVIRYEEVPKAFVSELMATINAGIVSNSTGMSSINKPMLGQFWTCSFEYGKGYGGYDEKGHVRDTLRADRVVRPFNENDINGPGAQSNFLHPVFRYNCYDDDSCNKIGQQSFHLGEDIHTTWNRKFDNEPLSAMFLGKHVKWNW